VLGALDKYTVQKRETLLRIFFVVLDFVYQLQFHIGRSVRNPAGKHLARMQAHFDMRLLKP
jgi:hypothetical protein